MKILAVSDRECSYLTDRLTKSPEVRDDIDVVLSCGDLRVDYLMSLADSLNRIIYYINGNHHYYDDQTRERLKAELGFTGDDIPGAVDLHGRMLVQGDYIICGLGGTVKYKDEAWQFTRQEMKSICRKLVRKVKWQLFKDRLFCRKEKRLIFFSHAPVEGLGDQQDHCHNGFPVFREVISELRPVLWLHGHVHLKDFTELNINRLDDTKIVNVYEFKKILVPAEGEAEISFRL